MTPKAGNAWIPVSRIESLMQLEPALFVLGLVVAALLIYKIFLREVSPLRHDNLRRLFKNISYHLAFATASFVIYSSFDRLTDQSEVMSRVFSYIGLISIVAWSTVFVKACRILLFEYLFFSHMKAGVPLLLVNLMSLVLTIFMGGWLLTELFNVNIGPVIATSAVFSIILGLALQDTLGNLFSGVAMQFDKPYEIGDWIEIVLNGQKWIGQVHEISWRATVLIGLSDESITVPNKLMGQTQISNFSTKTRPICRAQVFRLPYGSPTDQIKEILSRATASIDSVRRSPAPLIYIAEMNESWLAFKVVYFLDDYGAQFLIGDRVISVCTQELNKAGFELAAPRLLLEQA